MSIRLNKAIRELNIGFQTAVEFLTKKYNLEDSQLELTSKISDEQYESLIEVFKKDKETRNQVTQLFQKKPKEKKKTEVKDNRAETLLESSKQQRFNPLGKIDLDQLNKKPEEKNHKTSEKTVEKIVESVAPEKVEPEKAKVTAGIPETNEPKVKDKTVEEMSAVEVKEEKKVAPVAEDKPVEKSAQDVKPTETSVVDNAVKAPVSEDVPAEETKVVSQEKKSPKQTQEMKKADEPQVSIPDVKENKENARRALTQHEAQALCL